MISVTSFANARKVEGSSYVLIRDQYTFDQSFNLFQKNLPRRFEAFTLAFDDIWAVEHLRYGFTPISTKQLSALFSWAERKRETDLIVCCPSGISRSSAIAALLLVHRHGLTNIENIWKESLDIRNISPNKLILKTGMEMLCSPESYRIAKDVFQFPLSSDNDILIDISHEL